MANQAPLTPHVPSMQRLKHKHSPTPSDGSFREEDEPMDVKANPSRRPGPCLVVRKEFCNFCGDHMGEHTNQCIQCGGCMCEQTQPDGPGCILLGTLDHKVPFRCIVCEPRHWRRMSNPPNGKEGRLPYGFAGYGGRKRAKLAWPMVLVTFSLYTLPDKYVQRSLELDFQNQYLARLENLCLLQGQLKANKDKKTVEAIAGGAEFIRRSIESRVPANTFVVLDTHSHAGTGRLQWAGGKSSPKYSMTSEVVRNFLGPQFLSEMKKATEQALLGKESAANEWYDASPFSRGGWKGLLLATCAPVMRVEESFQDVRSLVESGTFDFVIGFAGASTLPTQIRNALSQVIEQLGVDKTASIWETAMCVIGHDLLLLDVNSVVVIFKERGSDEVLARKIARHAPPMRPWGVEFCACVTLHCEPATFDFFVQNDGYDVRMMCRVCRWKSAWVKECDWKQHVFRLDSTLPKVFWHSYPPSHALQNIFVEVSKEKERTAGQSQGKRRKRN